MKRIHKVDTRLNRTAFGKTAILFGLPFIGIGGYFTLGGFQVIPLAGKANAPLWVIGMVGLAFLLAGLLLAFRGMLGAIRKSRLENSRTPHQRWRGDYPWQPDGIRDNPHTRWLSQLVIFIFVIIFMTPFNWWAWLSDSGNLFLQILIGLFDLVMLAIFWSLIYRLLQAFKFGRSRLRFTRFPYAPGSRLQLYFSPNAFDRLKVTLRYVEERHETRRTGRENSTQHVCYEHWSEEKELTPPEIGNEVEIDFELPGKPEWVTQLTADPGIFYWELLLESELPGIDFRTSFPLPVYSS